MLTRQTKRSSRPSFALTVRSDDHHRNPGAQTTHRAPQGSERAMNTSAFDTQTTRQRFIGQSRCGKALPGGVKSTFLALCYEEKSGHLFRDGSHGRSPRPPDRLIG